MRTIHFNKVLIYMASITIMASSLVGCQSNYVISEGNNKTNNVLNNEEHEENEELQEEISGDLYIRDVEVMPASFKLTDTVGANGVILDYASDEIVIFHDYFGLFVYDLKEEKITQSVNLEEIGCQFTQGDAACEVSVSQNGMRIALHPMNVNIMYGYFVDQERMEERVYEEMVEPFKCSVNEQANGFTSNEAVVFAGGEKGYLSYEGGTLDDLYYICGEKQYKIF